MAILHQTTGFGIQYIRQRAPRRGRSLLFAALLIVSVLIVSAIWFPHPSNPPLRYSSTIDANLPVPQPVSALLHRACYDCHSDQTVWPWYSSVPPASWLLSRDVSRGRTALNFSEWSERSGRTPQIAAASLAAACDGLRSGSMPKRNYRLIHSAARVTPSEIREFCTWTSAQSALLQQSAQSRN